MNKGNQKFLKFLNELLEDEEKLNSFFNELMKQCEEEKEKALLFGQTEIYPIALNDLRKYLEHNGHACLDEYRDFVTPKIDNETFVALHAYAFYSEKVEFVRDVFPVEYVFHKGICFKKTHGQGTLYSACIYPNDTYVFFENNF